MDSTDKTLLNEINRTLGKLEERINDLCNSFDKLPCGAHSDDIQSLKDDRNKVVGIMAFLGLVFGAIGYFISPTIDWVMKHIIK